MLIMKQAVYCSYRIKTFKLEELMIGNINLKSELLSFKGQSVITPWDRLKKHIFDSYPVCRTEHNVTDEMELLAIAREYQNEAPMVWIHTESANIVPDFPWHYRPSDIGKNLVHAFPRVGRRSGRAVRWGDIKLVPTSGISYGIVKNKIHEHIMMQILIFL